MAFNLGDIFVTLKAKAEGLEQGIQKMQQVADEVDKQNKGLGRLADGMTNLGQRMTLGITTPLAALSAVAFKSSADFDKTMTQVGIAAGAAGNEVDKLRALAEKMGAETVFSAQDAADAMLALAKGGLTSAQIQAGALSATLTMATAGGIELGAAAGYMANGLQMFGLDASRAAEVTAALAGGANASTASIESMGLALSQVGPGAKLAGLSIQETVGALAAFDNAGIKGSDAGTSLKVMLLNLVPQTKAASTMMEDLGIKFTNADGTFKSLASMAQILKEKVGGLTPEMQQVALKTMFGTDAFRAAAILMGQGAAGIEKYTAATSDLGAAQRLADANMQGSAGAIERAKGAWETFVKSIGDIVAPAFVSLLGFLTKLSQQFMDLSPGMRTAIVVFAALVAGIGPLLLILGLVANAIVGISAALAVMNISLGVFGLIIVGIVALIAAVALLVAYWDEVKSFFVNLWWDIQKAFDTASAWIMQRWNEVKDFFVGIWHEMQDAVKSAAGAINDALGAALDWIRDKIKDVSKWIEDHKQALINWGIVITTLLAPKMVQLGIQAGIAATQTIIAWATAAGSAIASFVSMSIAAAAEAAKVTAAFVASAARSSFVWVTQELPKIIAGFVTTSAAAVANAVKMGATFVAQAAVALAGWVATFVAFSAGMVVLVAQFLMQAARMAAGWLLAMGPIGLIVAIVAGIVALIIANWDTVKQWLSAFWQWLQDTWDSLLNLLKTSWEAWVDMFKSAWEAIKNFIGAIWDGIKAAAEFVWNAIWAYISFYINAIMAIGSALGNAFAAIWNWIKDAGSAVWNAISSGFQWAWNTITSIWSSAGSFFSGIWDKIVQTVQGIGSGIGNAFSSAFEGAKNIAKGAVNWMIDKINTVINAVNNSAGKLPGVPKIGNIARLANGVRGFAGGLAKVGEAGPEFMYVPQGASVFSNTKSRQMAADIARGGGGGGGIAIYLDGANITSPHVADQYATLIGDAIINRLGKNTRL